ncbi:protein-tyrosine kinase 6-like [Leucoraja erinacea]|uniref:protein-tyrosine kinase 6-like n=1 Tax=Leucoraja erinaceus TaxID=7782 RepID=UPI002456466F|nr:protein-tyrosine kinase 6-like [Leucoraja erinacea]
MCLHLSISSVLDGTAVRHYRIVQNDAGQYHLNVVTQFSSLKELVEYYKMNCLRPGLQLSIPCQQQHRPNIRDLFHLTVDNWERPRSEFTLTEKLGSGHFGKVYAGYWNDTVQVAIKMVEVDLMTERDFQMETQIMKRLQHPHLMSLYATCTTSDPFYIVTELMEYGSLLNYLRSNEGSYLNLECLLDMTVQVAKGMEYLESQNYIHRDLAARNILVGENHSCKIADFGLARIIRDGTYVSLSTAIPYKWTAPEAIEFGYFSVKSDVWSFGILLYEVITYGKTPYPGMANQEVVRVVSRGYRMPCPDGCPNTLHQVMLSCWECAAAQRPSFATLVKTLSAFNIMHLY